jgi:XTP/dITP diphosphohydrolase
MARKLLLATHNEGKVVEFAQMLADLSLDWLSLDDVRVTKDVAETGQSFRENAVLKAQSYAAETGLLTLADDSGLEVDALDGRPGVYTAGYGGEGLNSVQRYQLLLKNLEGVLWERRTARFRCVIAVAGPDGTILGTSNGTCEGYIAMEPAGEGGFGYDPVFYLPDREKTMAQVSSAVKHQNSQGDHALKRIKHMLHQVLAQ